MCAASLLHENAIMEVKIYLTVVIVVSILRKIKVPAYIFITFNKHVHTYQMTEPNNHLPLRLTFTCSINLLRRLKGRLNERNHIATVCLRGNIFERQQLKFLLRPKRHQKCQRFVKRVLFPASSHTNHRRQNELLAFKIFSPAQSKRSEILLASAANHIANANK
jgi:hypothetical protein